MLSSDLQYFDRKIICFPSQISTHWFIYLFIYLFIFFWGGGGGGGVSDFTN